MTQTSKKAKAINIKAAENVTAKVRIVAAGPALKPAMSKVMTEIASDPQKSMEFLRRAGIITKAGKLAPKYA